MMMKAGIQMSLQIRVQSFLSTTVLSLHPRLPALALLAAVLVGWSGTAQAATKYWTGKSDTNWNNAGNWTGGAPVNGDTLIFTNASSSTATNLYNNIPTLSLTGGGLIFSNNASTYNISGSNITLSGSCLTLTNTSGTAPTNNITLNMPLTLAGYVTINMSTNTATLTLNGNIDGSTNGLTLAAKGTLVLNGTNSYGGQTIFSSSGSIKVGNTNALGNSHSVVANNGSSLYLQTDTPVTPFVINEGSGNLTIYCDTATPGHAGITNTLSAYSQTVNATFSVTTGATMLANSPWGLTFLSMSNSLSAGSLGYTVATNGTLTLANLSNSDGQAKLTKAGVGTLVITNGASTFTNYTSLSAGTLTFNSISNMGYVCDLGAYSGTATPWNAIQLTAGTLNYIGGSASTDRGLNYLGNTSSQANGINLQNPNTTLTMGAWTNGYANTSVTPVFSLTGGSGSSLTLGTSYLGSNTSKPLALDVAPGLTLTLGALTTAGGGGLIKQNTGTLILPIATTTFNGKVTANSGTLVLSNATCLGSGTLYAMPTATVDLHVAGITIGALYINGIPHDVGTYTASQLGPMFTGGSVNIQTATNIPRYWIGGSSANWNNGANWQDVDGITGTVPTNGDILIFTNAFSPTATNLNNDIPTLSFATSGGLVFSNSPTYNISGNGITLSGNGLTLNTNKDGSAPNITLNMPLTLAGIVNVNMYTNTSTLTLNGNISGGAYGLALSKYGAVVLNGSNSFSGAVTYIANGGGNTTLKVGNTNALRNASFVQTTSGGQLYLQTDTPVSPFLLSVNGGTTIYCDTATGINGITNTLTLSQGSSLNVTNGPNMVANSPYGLTFSTAASSTGQGGLTYNVYSNGTLTLPNMSALVPAFVKDKPGTLVMTNGASSFTNNVSIVAGTLTINTISNMGVTCDLGSYVVPTTPWAAILFGAGAGLGGGTLNYIGATGASTDRGFTPGQYGGICLTNANTTLTMGAWSNAYNNTSFALTGAGGSSLTLGTSYLGNATPLTMSVAVGMNLTLGALTTTNGAITFNKTGAGTLILNTPANCTGGVITVSAGTLQVGGVTGTADGMSSNAVASSLTLSGGNLDLASDTAFAIPHSVLISATTTNLSDRATSGVGQTHSLGNLSIGAYTLYLTNGLNVPSGTYGLSYAATTLTGSPVLDVAANGTLTLGTISSVSPYGITKQNSGTLALNGASVNTSAVTLTNNSGTIQLATATALGPATTLYTTNTATIDLPFQGTDTIYALYTNGVRVADGIYNASQLGGSPGFTGTGYLKISAARTVGAGGGNYATIASALAAAAAGDTISLPAGTYTESNLNVNANNLTITGISPTQTIVQAAASYGAAGNRVFLIPAAGSTNVTFQNMTIQYGFANGTTPGGEGGGICYYGPANGSILVTNCLVCSNYASGNGSGVVLAGNGTCTVTVVDSTFMGNVTAGSGAVYAGDGKGDLAYIYNSTFYNNSATNTAAASYGSAITLANVQTGVVQNCTIFSNTCSAGWVGSGGIGQSAINLPLNTANMGGVVVRNCTIVSNASPRGNCGGISYGVGGGDSVLIESCLIASNTCNTTTSLCAQAIKAFGGGGGTFTERYNFIDINSNSPVAWMSGNTNLNHDYVGTNTAPLNAGISLALANNGGPTLTLLPLSTSICIGHGTNSVGILWDQRESPYHRTVGGLTDIGAIQLNGLQATKQSGGTVMFFK